MDIPFHWTFDELATNPCVPEIKVFLTYLSKMGGYSYIRIPGPPSKWCKTPKSKEINFTMLSYVSAPFGGMSKAHIINT